MRKKSWIVGGVLFALMAAYVYATPYVTLFMLQRAIERKSAKDIEKLIDFPDVRDSLRSQLSEYIRGELKNDKSTSGFAELSAGIGSTIGSTFIDLVVQPSALQDWLNGSSKISKNLGNTDVSIGSLSSSARNAAMRYLDPETFEITFQDSLPLRSMVLQRRNIISWKIVEVRLDSSLFAANNSGSHGDNPDAHHSESLLSCDQAIRVVEDDINSRLSSETAKIKKNTPSSSQFYMRLIARSDSQGYPYPSDQSSIRNMLGDTASLHSYAAKSLSSCRDITTIAFIEHALDGDSVTYGIFAGDNISQCQVSWSKDKGKCTSPSGEAVSIKPY